ncbi:C40 family peptidase [Paenibacillus soyae]|uniref:C40 family peptidase n=1 Tax=Paenibacillus soyae TaxID=2969249 RepID=A0A9X2MTD2_9BACL|nr:SH3 domain-containing C40 family peptidase [Paenibacillus soyae]MCR2806125.1 C40 family peptidase [Paenibacillus soyae]
MKYTMKHKIATATMAAAMMFGTLTVLPSPAAHAAAAQSAEVTWGVNMRTAPSASGNVIRMLKKGEQVSVLATVGSWYKVSDASGRVGYISSSSKYTELNASSSGTVSGGTSSQVTAASTKVGTIRKSVSFREGASTSADRIRYLKAGEKVQITGQPSSYWYEVVDSSGVKGYVSSQSQYISVGSGTIGTGTSNSGSSSTGGSANTPSTVTKPSVPASSSVEKVIAAGMKYLGTPYEFGSNRSTTTTFDCSDFVRQAFKDALGITLPADSRQQGTYVKEKGNYTTNINNLKRGDLMFFMSYKGSSASSYSGLNKQSQKITHVGIYLGDGKILHTYSNESGGVTTSTVTGKHWEYRFMFGGSAL